MNSFINKITYRCYQSLITYKIQLSVAGWFLSGALPGHMTRVKPLGHNRMGGGRLVEVASEVRQTMDGQYCTGHFPSFSCWISFV